MAVAVLQDIQDLVWGLELLERGDGSPETLGLGMGHAKEQVYNRLKYYGKP